MLDQARAQWRTRATIRKAPELPLGAGQLSRSVVNAAHLKLNPPPNRFASAGKCDATTGVVVKHAYSLSVKIRPPAPRHGHTLATRVDASTPWSSVSRSIDVAGAPRSRPAHVGLVRFQPWPPLPKTRRPRSPDNVRRDGLRLPQGRQCARAYLCRSLRGLVRGRWWAWCIGDFGFVGGR